MQELYWCDLHEKKLDWAYRARTKLIEDCSTSSIFHFTDNVDKNGDILISVYGKSQRGKTTCILALLGIKNEYIKVVSDILRGSRRKGKSSTSTATMYKKSTLNQFGLEYNGINNYYTNIQKFKDDIDEIRIIIENAPSTIDIIKISIPSEYFDSYKENINFEIVDLPGIESSSMKEREQVQYIVNKYLRASSSVIIVEVASTLTDLENISFADYGIENWAQFKRFKVILTRAFSLESLQLQVLGKNENELYKNIKGYYSNEIKRSLKGKIDDEIEIYPLEFGESLNEFLLKCNELEKSNVTKVLNKLKRELIESVSESIGKEAQIIESVKLTHSLEKLIDYEEKEKSKEIEFKNIKRKYNKELINAMKELLESNNKEKKIYEVTNDKLSKYSIEGLDIDYTEALYMESELEYDREKIKNNDIVDELTEKIEKISELFCDGIKEEMVEELEIDIKIRNSVENEIETIFNIGNLCCFIFEYPDIPSMQFTVNNMFITHLLFFKKLTSDYKNVCNQYLKECAMALKVYIMNNYLGVVEKIKDILNELIQQLIEERESYISNIEYYETQVHKLDEEIIGIEKFYENNISRYKSDSIILSKFNIYLENEFKIEYNMCMREINSQIGNRKINYLLFAKLITEEYIRLETLYE